MKKMMIWAMLTAMLLGMLAGCGTTDPAPETNSTENLETEAMTQTYEAVPNQLFPTSKNAWAGDVMPMSDGNELKLYYLYDTDHNGPLYHPIWLFTTDNLYEYNDMGLAVPCGPDLDAPDSAIGTGCVMIDQQGKYHCFYTGHNDTAPSKGMDKECVMHAVSDDGLTWKKIPEDTFYAPDHYSTDDFRDPQVFWNEEAGCYWLIIAARDEQLGGIVARYRSDDLSTWELMDPLYAPKRQYMLECPDLFKMGEKYFLLYSWDCVTYYAVSDSINGPFVQAEDPVLASDGFSFYAAKTAELNGSRYLCGWIGRKPEPTDAGAYNWAGTIMNHELVLLEEGKLGVREPHTYSDYFTQDKTVAAVDTMGETEVLENGFRVSSGDKKSVSLVNFGQREPVFMLETDVTFTKEGFLGFCFGKDRDYNKYSGMVVDAKYDSLHFEGSVLSRMAYVDPLVKTHYDLEPGKTYHLKLVMENEIATLYIDDAKVLCVRVYKAMDGGDFGIFAVNTEAEFTNMTLRIPGA